MNPLPFVAWTFMGIVGYLVAGSTGALIGIALGLGLTLISEIL